MEATVTVPEPSDLERRARYARIPISEIARRCGVTRPHLSGVFNGSTKGGDTLLILAGRVIDDLSTESDRLTQRETAEVSP